MLTIHQPPRAWGLPNVSPFCLKLETYLRMTGRPYQVASPRLMAAPKGKVPWIEDGDVRMGDSGLIVEYLARTYGDPLDGDLDAAGRAQGLLLRRMVEEHLYFSMVYLRWTSDLAWPHLVEAFAPMMPRLLKAQGPKIVRRSIVKKARAQGAARHTKEEVLGQLDQDFTALATLLGQEEYFLGARARAVDATMYGFLAQLLWPPWESPEKDLLRRHGNLVTYVERMKEQYWIGWTPEQESWQTVAA